MSKNPWIRLYRESLHDPKIVTLNDRQHRAWHNCLLMANDDGVLPPLRDIHVHMRTTPAEAEQLICELVEAELVDVEMLKGARTYSMHGWSKRQYLTDSSAERTRKYRAKKKAVTSRGSHGDGDVTPPDTEADTDSEAETDSDQPTRESENLQLPPSSEDLKNFDLSGVGLGRVEQDPSPDAQREAARLLNVTDVEPLIPRFRRWQHKQPPDKRAKDVDALFVATAAKLFANAPEAIQRACVPIIEPAFGLGDMPHLTALLSRGRK